MYTIYHEIHDKHMKKNVIFTSLSHEYRQISDYFNLQIDATKYNFN